MEQKWYEISIHGNLKRFKPSKLAEQILKDYSIKYHKGNFFVYENGVYKMVKETVFMDTIIIQYLSDEFDTPSHIKKTIETLKGMAYNEEEPNNYPNLVNFKNCIIDIDKLDILEHDPKYFMTNQIEVNFISLDEYLNGKKMPRIEKMLKSHFPDEKDLQFIREFLGYCMIKDNSLQQNLIVKGSPRNGKSTIFNLFADLMGENCVAHVKADELAERFNTIALYGKLVNLCADFDDTKLKIKNLKGLTGMDKIKFEAKYAQPFWDYNLAKLIFVKNGELPTIDGQSEAAYERFIPIISKAPTIPYEDREPKLKDELKASEGEYFMNWCLYGLRTLRNRNWKFDLSEEVKELTEKWKNNDNPIREFLVNYCTPVLGKSVPLLDLFDSYRRFYNKTYQNFRNIQIPNTKNALIKFGKEAETVMQDLGWYDVDKRGRTTINGQSVAVWKNLKIKTTNET